MPSKDRIIRFHAALNGAKMMQHKADILSGYGAESTKELNDEQLDELIDRLNDMQTNRHEATREVRRARSTALTLLTRLGVYQDNRDWSAVNRYLLQPRLGGKLLYERDLEELKTLNKQLRKILRQREREIEDENYLAANN
jgi:hypothetical protein